MSRQSSAIPTSTSAPTIANGHVSLLHPLEKQSSLASRTVSMSVSKASPTPDGAPSTDAEPDELFVKHTVSEVKLMQQRLRTDADAKQEELRLMVGERYRDLLQASTSIIAIATSAQRVKQALDETKETILLQEEPPMPQQPSLKSGNDAHLHTLQLLSAHIKLLLDAPEHLWRLIERKKYFQAAWLFLLARVVHRALVREDEQDVTWSSQGIDVLDEFPLVQRQWDTVAQFRSQIIHKATLSLREYESSAEDTCATLLTLHLLDSRPLTESLSVFLAQRSKTLHSSLAWKYDSDSADVLTTKPNGHAPGPTQPNTISLDFRRRPVKEIKQATHTALDVISRTVKAARTVFQENDSCQPSLIRRVLEHIQSDSPVPQVHSTDLYLTTQSLLTTLPSSTHLLLLPPDLRSYKPYVDLVSSSSSVHPSQFAQKLDEWFQASISNFQKAVSRWFADLHSVKELWSVRASALRWTLASKLETNEISEMTKIFDESCRQRVVEIWRLRLAGSIDSFGQRLDSTLMEAKRKETSPVGFLFHAPPVPSSSQSRLDTSFEKYTSSLHRQLVGRTALLDDVLAALESCARTIRQDLAHVMAGNESPELVEQLEKTYRPDADALCANVIEKLEKTANEVSNTEGLVFLSRVSDELSTTSPFISEIGCQPCVVQDFRKTAAALHKRVVDRWRAYTVSSIVREHRIARRPIHPALRASLKPSGPSPELVQSLLALSISIQELQRGGQQRLVKATLEDFITELTSDDEGSLQSLYDMAFLQKLVTLHGEVQDELLEKRLREKVSLRLFRLVKTAHVR
ncbi:Conserved oligomeric Golgi complex subunit 1 [Termitomyces sp. J132]|nr:Conserved oligomeric Golgi complex subunit 1 [Termitomyces sp. J132]